MNIKFGSYLKERAVLLVLTAAASLGSVLLAVYFWRRGMHGAMLCAALLTPLVVAAAGLIHFRSRRHFFRSLSGALKKDEDELDTVLCRNLIANSRRAEDRAYSSVIDGLIGAITRQSAETIREDNNRLAYVEQWIHDVKNPLAAIRLICENNPSELMINILAELDMADGYVEKTLSISKYLAADSFYKLRMMPLKKSVHAAIIRNKSRLIMTKVRLNIHDIDREVYCESKWLEVILHQMLLNCINYRSNESPEIEICAHNRHGRTCLMIQDNGVGIKKNELSRVFDENFIGTNDVSNRNASGLGLYICARLAKKIGMTLEAESEYGKYTRMLIYFPEPPEGQ